MFGIALISMKSHVLTTALLGILGHVAADDQASMQSGSFCVTYLSTYLAPISNQGEPLPSKNLELERPLPDDTGRLPIPPLSRPTFIGNSSTTEDRTDSQSPSGSDTSLPDFEKTGPFPPSFVDSESMGIETISLDSTNGVMTDDVASTPTLIAGDLGSSLSSDVLPTSSGFIEPAGRLVLFVVVVTGNGKRNLNKRATGGFVAYGNPDVCTFAATFNLADNQLFEGGAPIYYSGEDFKELAGQGVPPADAITTTFSDSTQGLIFRNSALPNGRAGYCQGTDGKVYITFASGPPGCTPVDIAVYNVEQCQNGVLVGLQSSGSASSNVPTPETSTPQVASGSSTPVTQSTDSVLGASSFSSGSELSTVPSSKRQSSEQLDSTTSTTDSSISVETSTNSISEHISASLRPAETSLVETSTSSETSPPLESTTFLSDESSTSATSVEVSTDSTVELESSSLPQVGTSSIDISTSLDTSPLLESTTFSSEESSTSSVLPKTESQSDSETAASSDLTTIVESTSDAMETTSDATTQETANSSGDETTTQIPTTIEDTTTLAPTSEDTSTLVSTSEVLSTTQEATTAPLDACVSGLTSPDGEPPLPDRGDDCNDLNVVTVSPYTVTTTVVENRLMIRIPTGWPTPRATLTQLARRQAEEATTITPTETPDYATYCDSPSNYFEACSSLGVTRFTTTLPTPTKTETSTEPQCFVRRMVKRAGEGLGYEYESDWAAYRNPGIRIF